MATKKKTGREVLAELRKEFNTEHEVIGTLTDINKPQKAYSTGNIGLDFLTGIGGFPHGKIVELHGEFSSGKSTSAFMAMAKEQQKIIADGDEDALIVFLDYERSLDPKYCYNLGLDVSHESFVYIRPDNLEQGVNLFRRLLSTGSVRIACFDSVAAMVSAKEKEAETGVITVADRAKAQPLTAKVLTPTGWSTMGDMSIGQKVLTPKGDTASVIGIYPQGTQPVYKITCSDGTETEAAADHLWTFTNGMEKSYPGKIKQHTMTTVDMKKFIERGKRWTRAILPEVSVDYPEVDHLLSPYVLGSLIGDGSMTERNGTSFCAHVDDADEQFGYLREGLPEWSSLTETEGYTRTDIRLARLRDDEWRPVGYGNNIEHKISAETKRLGLAGKIHHEKMIPDEYMFDSRENRIELLRGLMDTDGTLRSERRSGTFSTVSETLARQVVDLVHSLGGDASLNTPRTGAYVLNGIRHEARVYYKVSVRTPFNPFKLKRKADNWIKPDTRRQKSVISVEYVRDDIVQCIEIDHQDHLYLTDGLIPTHNSLHQVCRQIKDDLDIYGTTAIFLNHTLERVATDPMSQKMAARGIKRMTQPGGQALPFYASLRIEYKKSGQVKTKELDALKDAEDETVSGQKITATVVKNKVAPAFSTTELRVRRNKGFSQSWSVLNVLVSHGVISAGPTGWYLIPERLVPTMLKDKVKDGNYKLRSEEAILKALDASDEFLSLCEAEARSILEQFGLPKIDGSVYNTNGEIDENSLDEVVDSE